MSVVFASSTCDLSAKILKKVDVDVINLPILLDGKACTYAYDKFDFDSYYVSKNIEVDTTKYEKLLKNQFELALKSGQDVLFITPYAKYDNTYKLVRNIIKYFEPLYPEQRIELFSCNNISLGYGLVVYQAGILNMHGENISEIVKYLSVLKKNIKTIVIPSTTNAKLKEKLTIVGGSIGFRPVLSISNGEPKLIDNVKGKKNIHDCLVNLIKKNNLGDMPIGIMHGKNVDDGLKLEKDLNDALQDKLFINAYINPMVNEQFGDNTIAISFYKKSKN